ncbi:MAG: cobalamin-independent methionine synthase II family protein [Chloroflexi bacterium]|nr:cobalamin-independent methionine synthase II family protein [Chloroflexota bacterium]
MKRSTERILTSHAGTVPRPDDLRELMAAGPAGEEGFNKRLPSAVAEVVRGQAEAGIDIVNDGEMSKRGGFSRYARDRLGGLEEREPESGNVPEPRNITGRDQRDFPGFHTQIGMFGRLGARAATGAGAARRVSPNEPIFCTGPLKYIGHQAARADIDNFKAALQGVNVEGAFLPAIAPGTIEHWLWNEHYPDEETFLFAIADAMHEEYKAITDAGFILQIDDPDLPDGWQMYPEMTVPEYQKYAELRVDALNRALRDCPEELVRLHICWGSGHGPHKNDIPLRDIIDIVLKVRAECFSIEASNPRHEHEWRVWQDVKLPEGKILMPGIAGHATDIIEHPELVAERVVKYAGLVGRENVIVGTDCGIGSRVSHPEIAWAKFQAMAEGARLATRQLWGR